MEIRCNAYNGYKFKRVEGYSFVELYNKLCDLELISLIDYDPYIKARCKKAGVDYEHFMFVVDVFENEVGMTDEVLKDFPDLTDKEIYYLIVDETERCGFCRWDITKGEWIGIGEDEMNGIEWFDENGELIKIL